MSTIITIHSFRGGTGKTSVAANTAALLAAEGLRVGVVDGNIQAPGLHDLTLLSITLSNKLVILLRPDQQELEGTSVSLAGIGWDPASGMPPAHPGQGP